MLCAESRPPKAESPKGVHDRPPSHRSASHQINLQDAHSPRKAKMQKMRLQGVSEINDLYRGSPNARENKYHIKHWTTETRNNVERSLRSQIMSGLVTIKCGHEID